MYVYFSLMRSIFDLENNEEKLDQFLKSNTFSDVAGTLETFRIRGDKTKENLASQALIVQRQLDTFLGLIKQP